MNTVNKEAPQGLSEAFPKARMDAMTKFARGFNARSHRPGDKLDDGYDHAPLWTFSGDGRMDAATSIFIARQLEEIRAGLYEVKYGKLKAERITPFNTSINRGVNDYTVRAVDQHATPSPGKAGEAAIPTLRMNVTPMTVHFESWFLAYEYTLQEAHEAAYANMPLSANLAMLTRERQARMLDQLALVGDSTNITAVKGIFNQTIQASAGDSGVLPYALPTDGTGSATNVEAKTSDQIIRDLNGPINTVITTTLEVEQPDTLVIPTSVDCYIAQRRVGDGTSWTIRKFFTENQPGVDLERSSYLENLGASGTDVTGPFGSAQRRMVAYQNDPTRFEILVSVLFDQTAPQFHGLGVKTITEIRTAGCALYLPKSVAYGDGI